MACGAPCWMPAEEIPARSRATICRVTTKTSNFHFQRHAPTDAGHIFCLPPVMTMNLTADRMASSTTGAAFLPCRASVHTRRFTPSEEEPRLILEQTVYTRGSLFDVYQHNTQASGGKGGI